MNLLRQEKLAPPFLRPIEAFPFETDGGEFYKYLQTETNAVFDASRINQADGTSVAAWNDVFGRGSATQAVVANQPTFDADGLNGQSCVVFDGVDDFMQGTGLIPLGTNPVEMIFVAKPYTVSSQRSFIAQGSSSSGKSMGLRLHTGGTARSWIFGNDLTSSAVFATPNESFIISTSYTPGSRTIRKNGFVVGQDASTAKNIVGSNTFIGAGFTGLAEFFSGAISFIFIAHRILSSPERNWWHNYLSQRYAIPLL